MMESNMIMLLLLVLVVAYILVCGIGEGLRLRECYCNRPTEERVKLQIEWHWAGLLRSSLPLFIGWFGFLIVTKTSFELGQFVKYVEFLLVVGSVWWWFYDGMVNTLMVPVRPWHQMSTSKASQFNHFRWLGPV